MSAEPPRAIPGARQDAARTKQELRRAVRERRASIAPADRAAADAACARLLQQWLRELRPATVAAYVAVGPEPDLSGLLDWLHGRGTRLLLPVLRRHEDGSPRHDPDWAWFTGAAALREGIWGIREPAGEPLGADALVAAEVVLIPALGADPAGHRLGTGGGWYDRALLHAAPAAPRCAVLRESELSARIATEPHDVPMTHLCTDRRLLRCNPSV